MVTLRDFIDSDAKNIVVAVRETYGEEYTPEFMYDEGILILSNQKGTLKFTVAETENGEFVGVIGLKIVDYFLGVVEVVSLIVREKFRELHTGTSLFEASMKKADSENIPSIYGSAAIISDYSQHIMRKLGYQATGLWLNRKFFSDKIKDGKQYKSDKVNMIVMVRNHNVTDIGVLYLPMRYARTASACYKRFGVTHSVCNECVPPEENKTVFTQSGYEDFCNKNIFVYSVGMDFDLLLDKFSVLENELSSVSVLIDLKNKSAVWAIGRLECLGYRFTGFIPLAIEHEYAIFHLCRCNVSYDEFAICEQFNYIREKLE